MPIYQDKFERRNIQQKKKKRLTIAKHGSLCIDMYIKTAHTQLKLSMYPRVPCQHDITFICPNQTVGDPITGWRKSYLQVSVHMSALRYHFLVRARLLNGMYLVIYSNVRSCYDNMPFVSFGLLVILSTSVAKIA